MTQEITIQEVEEALIKVKVGRVLGIDRIEPKLMKCTREAGKEWLLKIFRTVWETEIISKKWEKHNSTDL